MVEIKAVDLLSLLGAYDPLEELHAADTRSLSPVHKELCKAYWRTGGLLVESFD
jgi:hypothetical protein